MLHNEARELLVIKGEVALQQVRCDGLMLQIFDSGSREPGKTWENIAEKRILTAPASSFTASGIFKRRAPVFS